MVRGLVRVAVGFSLLLGSAAFAEGECACGKPAEECQKEGCTCGQGDGAQCALHRGKGPMPMPMGKGMGMGMGGMAMPTFDPKTVGTFKGTVSSIERVEHHQGMVGVHLRVQAGADTLVVHLGPSFFVDPKMTFAAKDEVEVKGSKISLNGQPTVLATTVTKAGKSLDLRKADGTPLFRGPPGK